MSGYVGYVKDKGEDKNNNINPKLIYSCIDGNLLDTYVNNVVTNFRGLNVLEDRARFESFAISSIDSLLIYEKKILFTNMFIQLPL